MSKPVVKRHTFNLKGEERKLDGVREHVVTFLVTGETTVPIVFDRHHLSDDADSDLI